MRTDQSNEMRLRAEQWCLKAVLERDPQRAEKAWQVAQAFLQRAHDLELEAGPAPAKALAPPPRAHHDTA
jgi:hypothetical protein